MTSASARHLRNGLLRPWVEDWAEGRDELDRLKAMGLDVDLDPFQCYALGVALAEQRGYGHEPALDLDPTPEFIQALKDITADWHPSLARAQHDLDHRQGRPHDHKRMRQTGQAPDQAHIRSAPELHPEKARHSGHRDQERS